MNDPKLEDFENYAKLNHEFGSISGKAVYNVQDEQFVENTADSVLTYKNISFDVGYYKYRETDNIFNDRENLESYRVGTSYRINRDYKTSYYEYYDLLENNRNRQGISFNIDDSCWNLDLKFEKTVLPTSSRVYNVRDQNIIYITILLKPLGGINQNYRMNEAN